MPGNLVQRGAEVRLGPLSVQPASNDPLEAVLTYQLRMDMWPLWLHEAIDAAVAARDVHGPLVHEATSRVNDQQLATLLDLELRASMRAMTSSAFAVDAFYASVQARSPEHPDRAKWRTPDERGRLTPRHVQVYETLRYSLKMNDPAAAEIRRRIKQLLWFRNSAVHANVTFRDPVRRQDIDLGVDWHNGAFSAGNATAALRDTLDMLDAMVTCFDRASKQLRAWAPFARERMDEVLDRYDAHKGLPPVERHPRRQSE